MVIVTADKLIYAEEPKRPDVGVENFSLGHNSGISLHRPSCLYNNVSSSNYSYETRQGFGGNQAQVFEISTTAAANDEYAKRMPGRTGRGRHVYGKYGYAELIEMAIGASPDQRLTLDQIYRWISAFVPDINRRTNGESSWKNSVRHSLSFRKHFTRVHADGYHWWTVDHDEKAKGDARRRAHSMDSKELEEARQRANKILALQQRPLSSIPSQDLLSIEPNEIPVYNDEKREMKSKFPYSFKKGVQKCVQKLKNVVGASSSDKNNFRRSQSLREAATYSKNEFHSNQAVQITQIFNNPVGCSEQYPQVASYDATNQLADGNVNFCKYTDYNPNSQFYNNYYSCSYPSNEMLLNSQPMRERRNTASSTSSDYLQDWQYFTGEQVQDYNVTNQNQNQNGECDHLNALANKLTLQPLNEAAEAGGYYNQGCEDFQFSQINDNYSINDPLSSSFLAINTLENVTE